MTKYYLVALIFSFIFFCKINLKAENSQQKAEKSKTYSYWAYLPTDYKKSEKKLWPLIIYLHGSSCKGNNLDKLKKYGPPAYIDKGMDVDAIVVSPQCPMNRNWTTGNWFESFYQELTEKYNIDSTRVYLTGMSLGGFGTWDLASRFPEYFAAVMPLCGGGRPDMAATMKDLPTWVFHGEYDRKVKLFRSVQMVEAMEELGGTPKFSILKGEGHDIHSVYGEKEVYDWLLSQHKGLQMAYRELIEKIDFWSPKTEEVKSEKIKDNSKLAKSTIKVIPEIAPTKSPLSFFGKLFDTKTKSKTQTTIH